MFIRFLFDLRTQFGAMLTFFGVKKEKRFWRGFGLCWIVFFFSGFGAWGPLGSIWEVRASILQVSGVDLGQFGCSFLTFSVSIGHTILDFYCSFFLVTLAFG